MVLNKTQCSDFEDIFMTQKKFKKMLSHYYQSYRSYKKYFLHLWRKELLRPQLIVALGLLGLQLSAAGVKVLFYALEQK